MDNLLIFIVVTMIVILPVMLFIQAQKRQDEQLSGILAKLSSMEGQTSGAAAPPTDPYDLRRERSARIGELVMLEADLVRNARPPTPEELNGVDAVRGAVKALNERIADAGDWKGPPYDLEWAEIFDQFPTTKRAFISAEPPSSDQRM